jgi:hypothetical protein
MVVAGGEATPQPATDLFMFLNHAPDGGVTSLDYAISGRLARPQNTEPCSRGSASFRFTKVPKSQVPKVAYVPSVT